MICNGLWLAEQLPVKALQLSPIWRCNILQKYFAFFSKKCLQKTDEAKNDIEKISDRIANYQVEIELQKLIYEVGNNGKTFTSAIFNGKRSVSNFREMQIFGLDFDKGNLSCEEIIERGKQFGLSVVFVYETLSSSEILKKYRVGFLHIAPVGHKDVGLFILRILGGVYPEADKMCLEVSRMFLGGKKIIYYDKSEPMFRVDTLAREYQIYSKSMYTAHFARNQKKIVRDLVLPGIGDNKLFNIDTYSDGKRIVGDYIEDEIKESGEKLGTANIYIIELPKISQKIVFSPSYQQDRCEKKREYIGSHIKSDTVSKMCRLWKDFINGERLSHEERFLLATNIRHIKGLEKVFLGVIAKYYDSYYEWKYYMDYNLSRDYHPKCCDDCPYANECVHEKNMVLTVTGRKSIVRLDVEPKYVPIEVAYDQLQQALYDSVFSNDEDIHLIRAQTSLGKTQAFVELAKNKEGRKPLLIAVPLINLKEEIAERLSSGGGEQIPSWKQIELPLDLREEVDALYKAGYYKDGKDMVHQYSKNAKIMSKNMEKYQQTAETLKRADRNIVITHAQLRTIPADILKKYEIVIDEDWLFTALKSSGSIPVHELHILIAHGIIGGTRVTGIQELLTEKKRFFRNACGERSEYVSQEDMNKIGASCIIQI